MEHRRVALRRLRGVLPSLPFPDKSGGPPIHSRTILKPPRARHVYRSIAAQNSVAVCYSHSSLSRAGHRRCGTGSGNASAIIASTVAIALTRLESLVGAAAGKRLTYADLI